MISLYSPLIMMNVEFISRWKQGKIPKICTSTLQLRSICTYSCHVLTKNLSFAKCNDINFSISFLYTLTQKESRNEDALPKTFRSDNIENMIHLVLLWCCKEGESSDKIYINLSRGEKICRLVEEVRAENAILCKDLKQLFLEQALSLYSLFYTWKLRAESVRKTGRVLCVIFLR